MTPHDVYMEATRRGLQLKAAGDKLAVFPKGRCPSDFALLLRQHKDALLDWLSHVTYPGGWQTVPPDDLPLDPGVPRPTPRNREIVIGYLARQTANRHCPLSAWLVQRESAY